MLLNDAFICSMKSLYSILITVFFIAQKLKELKASFIQNIFFKIERNNIKNCYSLKKKEEISWHYPKSTIRLNEKINKVYSFRDFKKKFIFNIIEMFYRN